MDVHRCRFVDYTPSAINALAFSHASGKASRDQPLRLAIGRANGNIEIWDPKKGAWIHEITLYGGLGRSVDGLAWVQDPDEKDDTDFIRRGKLRLFSIGYSSTVTEWSLVTGLPLRESGGHHGEVWCLAAQPVWSKAKARTSFDTKDLECQSQDLVAGCADGSLVLLSTTNDSLTFKKIISRSGKKAARALSISFQSRNIVVVGFADSSVRVYDLRNGNLIRNISVGGGASSGPKETLIWAVECLQDGTIVAGDSNGEISFWDGVTYGQLQRIKAHGADILCLASSADGQTVLSSGIDRRTCVYSLVDGTGSKRRWAKIAHKRLHRHDVKAMARFENSKMSVVVSGGLDTAPVLIPLRNLEKEYHRQLPFVPQCSPVTGSQRLVATWRTNEVAIWHISGDEAILEGILGQNETKCKPMANMTLKSEENVTSASLSASGHILAVSTVAQTSLFHLRPTARGGEISISISKIKTPVTLSQSGGRLTCFSPDSRWLLVVKCDNTTQLHRIVEHPDTGPYVVSTAIVLPRLERSDERKLQNCLNGHWGSFDRTITRATFSSDGRLCAASDLGGRIDTWILEGHEDLSAPPVGCDFPAHNQIKGSAGVGVDYDDALDDGNRAIVIFGQHWIRNPCGTLLPRLPSTPLVLSFRPAFKSSILGNYTSRFFVQQIPNGNQAIHPTRRNSRAHSHSLPSYPTCDDRLLVLTASHELFEFHAVSGKLTDWSKANPPALLPDQFKLQRDRAIGAVWDIARERAWIYSATWLAMFDFRLDLQGPAPAPSAELAVANGNSNGISTAKGIGPSVARKRRRSSTVATVSVAAAAQRARAQMASRQNTSDVAGSAMRPEDLGGSPSVRNVQKLTANGRAAVINENQYARDGNGIRDNEDIDGTSIEDNMDSTYAPDSEDSGLHEGLIGKYSSTKHMNAEDGLAQTGFREEEHDTWYESSMPFYLTTRYRQILGLVPLRPAETEEVAKRHPALEVALLERPFAALNLGPRFIGGQERER